MECGSQPSQKSAPAPAAAGRSSNCSSCGAEYPPSAKFCPECGAKPGGGALMAASAASSIGDASGPSCAGCGRPIGGHILTALEKAWHPECFVCSQCAKPFSSPSFVVRQGKPWCDPCVDWDAKERRAGRAGLTSGGARRASAGPAPASAPAKQEGLVCAGCHSFIADTSIVFRDEYYHKGCLKCKHCDKPIDVEKGFLTKSNQPYHQACAKNVDQDLGLTCTGCKQPVSGKFIKPEGKPYHVDCFVCAECKGSLMQGYATKGGLNYCGSCARKPSGAGSGVSNVAPSAGVRYNQFTGEVTSSYAQPKSKQEAAPAPAAPAAAGGSMKCTGCDADIPSDAKFCGECGTKPPAQVARAAAPAPAATPVVAAASTKCTGCGAELEAGAKFCGECGAKPSPAQAAPAAAAAPLSSGSAPTPAPVAAPATIRCAGCGATFPSDAKFCGECGAKPPGAGGAPAVAKSAPVSKPISQPAAKPAAAISKPVVRPSVGGGGKPVSCKRCYALLPGGAQACSECGWKVPPKKELEPEPEPVAVAPSGKFCGDCGGGVPAGANTCPGCGGVVA